MTENEDLISRSTLLDSFRKCYSGHMGMENSDNMMMFKSICRIINDQEAIGTIDEFKALREKSVAKKAIGKRKYDEAYCPACNEVISDGEFWALDEYVHHCNYCGQAVKGVDWSE